MNAFIAARQHAQVRALAVLQPGRSVLVQPLTAQGKATLWSPLASVPPGAELWTRSVLLNEVLFDVDARPWSRVAEVTGKLTEALNHHGAQPWQELTGGKGTHTSLFFDPASIKGPESTLKRARDLGLDVWSVARLTIAEAVLTRAGFATDAERWAPPLGQGCFDRFKVKWSALRQGSMVRVTGCAGSAGFRKTSVTGNFFTQSSPSADVPLAFPEPCPPRLWPVPADLNAAIFGALESAVARAEAARMAAQGPANPLLARAALMRCACASRVLTQPTPSGSRHYAFLNLFVTMKALGLPRATAEREFGKVLTLNGLPASDPAWGVLDEVYSGRFSTPKLSCPSPHVGAWCKPNGCPFSARFEFGAARARAFDVSL